MTANIMEKKKPPTLEQIENTIEVANNSLRTALSPLGELTDWQKQLALERAVKEAIQDLVGASYDLELRRPMIVATGDIPHICDDCEVTLNNLPADEHCHGCRNEAELTTYVPKDLRYQDPTEVSLEDDEPI